MTIEVRGRLGILVCAAALAATPLPARSANGECTTQHRACGYAVDRQGAAGRLNGSSASYAEFDAYGENFRAVIGQPPTVAISTRSYGCVTFLGQVTVEACGGAFTVTTTGGFQSAQVIGTATSGVYTISVNVTLTGRGLPEAKSNLAGTGCVPPVPLPTVPVPTISPTASPPALPSPSPSPPALPVVPTATPSPPSPSRVCFAYANPGLEREADTSGTITLRTGGSVVATATIPDEGFLYGNVLAEIDIIAP